MSFGIESGIEKRRTLVWESQLASEWEGVWLFPEGLGRLLRRGLLVGMSTSMHSLMGSLI